MNEMNEQIDFVINEMTKKPESLREELLKMTKEDLLETCLSVIDTLLKQSAESVHNAKRGEE